MTRKPYPTDILSQAIEVQVAWSEIDEGMTFGKLDMGGLGTDINHLRTIEQSLTVLETQLTEMRNQRHELCQTTWDKVKRVRAGVKSFFGDDSAQYDLIGGTRVSERKAVHRTSQLAVE